MVDDVAKTQIIMFSPVFTYIYTVYISELEYLIGDITNQ